MFNSDVALFQAFADCIKETAKLHLGCVEVAQRQETEKLAYFLWEEAGKPDGRSEEFWLRAERVLGYGV